MALACAVLLNPSKGAAQSAVELNQLPTTGSVSGSDYFLVERGTTTPYLATLASIGNWISLNALDPIESANTVHAGPASGSAAAAGFRPLVPADLPAVTPSGGTSASTLSNLAGRLLSVQDFGAKCDGTTDDTTALQNALNYAAGNGKVILLPAGTCLFSSPLTEPYEAQAWGVAGQGQTASWLVYDGTSTTVDLIKFGSATSAACNLTSGLVLQNFGVDSNTKMTAGAALHIDGATASQWYDLQFSRNIQAVASSQKLWNGFWNDSSNTTWLIGYAAAAQNDAVDASGQGSSNPSVACENIGPSFYAGIVLHATIGVHDGGGVGGLFLDGNDILENATDLQIDTAISGKPNDQVVLASGNELDGTTTGPDIYVNTTIGTGPQMVFGGWIASAGTFSGSGSEDGIQIHSCTACQFSITGNILGTRGSAIGIDATATGISSLISSAHIWQYDLANAGNAGIACAAAPTYMRATPLPVKLFSGSGVPISAACPIPAPQYETFSNPNSTTSTSGVMAGLAGSFLAPDGGEETVTACMQMSNNTAGGGVNADLRFGSGAAPGNGAALAGTIIAGGYAHTSSTAGAFGSTCETGVATGLAAGTTYWVDMGEYALAGGTASLANVQMTLVPVE